MSLIPQTRQGGTKSWQVGSLKRRLPVQRFATLKAVGANTGIQTATFKLTGLSGALSIQIAAGLLAPDGTMVRPSQYLAGGITMQLTPINNFGDAGRMMLRPVFQDPTLPVNTNNPLPMDLPFGWEFSTECDEVWIDLNVNRDWSSIFLPVNVAEWAAVLEVTIEYTGDWQDINAVETTIGQVNLTPGSEPISVSTNAG